MDKDSKKLLWIIVIIIAIFTMAFFTRFLYGSKTGAAVTIDELHKKNLDGEESETNYLYGGFSFVYIDNLWYTQIKRDDNTLLDVPLHYGPLDLENISIKGSVDEKFQQTQIYITFDPKSDNLQFVALASAELGLNLVKGIEILPIAACSKNETAACEDRPIVTCDDKEKAIIYLMNTEEDAEVVLKGNCVELKGNDWELVKATDRFLLQWYQVMK